MLLAVSDLHVSHGANRALVESFRPGTPNDWLLLAGDIAEREADFEWVISTLAGRFRQVVWCPGNHELWCHPNDTLKLPGVHRYSHLVDICRRHGVATPEDEFQRYTTSSGMSALIVPVFALYDYSFRSAQDHTAEQAIERARRAGVMSCDQYLLKTYPYGSVVEWCDARIEYTERRLEELPDGENVVLLSHFPLIREPTEILRNAEIAIWCGTEQTRQWPAKYGVRLVVYGHLHVPRVDFLNGVAHVEVSMGYPREWQERRVHPRLVELDWMLKCTSRCRQ